MAELADVYAYRWKRNGSDIGGATSSTYTVQAADVAQQVTCSVTASNADGSSLLAATSLPVIPIAAVDDQTPVNLTPPVVTGTAQQGSNLACSNGTWLFSPTSYAYKWKRDGSAISGATSSSYPVQSDDVGHQVSCSVVATNDPGDSVEATSLPVVPIALTDTGKPVNLLPPIVTGTAMEGRDLSCSNGTWLNSPTSYSRQWKRDGAAISGATSATYIVQTADVGHQLTCSVTSTNGAGDSAEATSLPVIPIALTLNQPPVAVLPPVIGGIARQGQDVTCSDGVWLGSPTSYGKQWKRNGSAIGGATSGTYTIQAADVGQLTTCSVVASNGNGSQPSTSLPVVPIGGLPLDTAKPQISGTARPGQQLACSDGSWSPAADSFSRVWKRGGSAISGATSSTYTVQPGDVGAQVTCTVTATNVFGSADATSDPVTVTGNPPGAKPANSSRPVVSVVGGGVPRRGKTLSCSRGGWTGSPTSFAYGWTDGSALVPGLTRSTVPLGPRSAGKRIGCRVSATNSNGTTTAASATVTVQPALAEGGADRTAPAVSRVSMTRKRFAAGRSARRGSAFRSGCRRPPGCAAHRALVHRLPQGPPLPPGDTPPEAPARPRQAEEAPLPGPQARRHAQAPLPRRDQQGRLQRPRRAARTQAGRVRRHDRGQGRGRQRVEAAAHALQGREGQEAPPLSLYRPQCAAWPAAARSP